MNHQEILNITTTISPHLTAKLSSLKPTLDLDLEVHSLAAPHNSRIKHFWPIVWSTLERERLLLTYIHCSYLLYFHF